MVIVVLGVVDTYLGAGKAITSLLLGGKRDEAIAAFWGQRTRQRTRR